MPPTKADAAGTKLIASSSQVYDFAGRMISLTHTDASNSPLAGLGYQHDRAGRVIEIDSLGDGVAAYQYDVADQVLSASRYGVRIGGTELVQQEIATIPSF